MKTFKNKTETKLGCFWILFPVVFYFFLFSFPYKSLAADYYASPSGSGTACTLASPCSLSTLNTKLQAGDTGYLRGGTYSQQIAPANNGASINPIIYSRYNSESANITYTGGNQVNLVNKTGVMVDGIRFSNASNNRFVNIENSSYVTIRNCYMSGSGSYYAFYVVGAQYCKIQNNEMHGNLVPGFYPGDLISIWNSAYNLIEGNNLNYCVHAALGGQYRSYLGGVYSRYNVFRNNTINNPWHTAMGFTRSNYPDNTTDMQLWEGNIVLDAGSDFAQNPEPETSYSERENHNGFQLNRGRQIIRNNIILESGTALAIDSWALDKYEHVIGNHIYNNTIHNSYEGIISHNTDTYPCENNYLKNNTISNTFRNEFFWNNIVNSQWKNFFTNNNFATTNLSYTYKGSVYADIVSLQTKEGDEFVGNREMNPLFKNADAGDFTLQPTSPLINAGAFLTTVTSAAGNGTAFTVADAGYFTDGWGIIEGDTIQLQNQTITAKITGIDYASNRVTVDRAMSWTQGLGVALAYSGSAPDIGAKEYASAGDTAAPSAPGGLSVR